MGAYIVLLFFIINIMFVDLSVCESNDFYHVKSKVTLRPDEKAEYFGFTVLFKNNQSIIIGAPKANLRIKTRIPTGLIFECSIILSTVNITCYPLQIINEKLFSEINYSKYAWKDMWLGAAMTTLSDSNLLVCAPRWGRSVHVAKTNNDIFLQNGICFSIEDNKTVLVLDHCRDMKRQAFLLDGNRPEYGRNFQNIYYYGVSSMGMSLKATSTDFIIGAPGILERTGGILDYKTKDKSLSKQHLNNPYYTKDLFTDDYFGYSVDLGVFELAEGSTLFISGAPRAASGFGQVFIFLQSAQETLPLMIKAKIKGPQFGSYFGASILAIDLNNDGSTDLLVGAPLYIKKGFDLPYDQGAVFVYKTRQNPKLDSGFDFVSQGYVSGSDSFGARFGTAIADLGDLDHDGFQDVAIGAPHDNDGIGVVYIYEGSPNGLKSQYAQKIFPEDGQGFGLALAKGIDIDNNGCNELLVGAFLSETSYIYRCVPSVVVIAEIFHTNIKDLSQNDTIFTPMFCVRTTSSNYPKHKISLNLKATIIVDSQDKRASLSDEPEFNIHITNEGQRCFEPLINVKPAANLTKPISLKFILEPKTSEHDSATLFSENLSRISDKSTLQASFDVALTRGCGNDTICEPWLVMSLNALSHPFIPGLNNLLGFQIIVSNTGEAAYDAKINVTLPLSPKRIPGVCQLLDLLMTCDLPSPLFENDKAIFEIELEYEPNDNVQFIRIEAEIRDTIYDKNITDQPFQVLNLYTKPISNITLVSDVLPNSTLSISRNKLYDKDNVSFAHYFEIFNSGPSDCLSLSGEISYPKKIHLTKDISGCLKNHSSDNVTNNILICTWIIPAKSTVLVTLNLKYDLNEHGEYITEKIVENVSTSLLLKEKHISTTLTTTLILDPASPTWPIILGLIFGFILLSIIVYGLKMKGFFLRKRVQAIEVLQDENPEQSQSGSADKSNESLQKLILEDSDSE